MCRRMHTVHSESIQTPSHFVENVRISLYIIPHNDKPKTDTFDNIFYIRSHSWQCTSEQKPSHEVEGIVRRTLRQDCVKAQICGRVPKHFCSVDVTVPKNTAASIILKGKKFGTTKTLPRAGRLAKLSNRGHDGHSDRAPEFLCRDGINFQKDNHLCSTPQIRP